MKNLVKSVSCVLVGMAVFGFFSCKGETEYVDRIVEKEVEKPSDTTPPAQINAETVTATAGNNTVLLSWTNPSDEDFYGTEISFAPESSGVTQPVIVKGSQAQKSSVIFNGLANGTEYTFTLVALDKSLNRASGTTKTATPVSNADSTPPAKVTELVATEGNGKIILAWTNPADEDFFGVRISEKSNGGTLSNAVFLQNPANTFTVSELANGTAYEFSVIALDKALNESGAVTASGTPVDSADETPPENVTELTVVANDGNAVISWKNPTETDFAGVEVNANPAVGTLFYPLLLRKEANTLSVSGLTVGESYEFMVKAYDQSLNFASGISKTVTVGDTGDHTPPHIVANLRATNKGGAVLLTWEEASDTDGDLLCYEVTYESVAITVSKGTNYCYVTNLTNGTEYTFTVKSVDTSGNKSEGVTTKETPVAIDAGDTMKIELSAPEALSNTSTPVTAKITSASKIKKVVYKKNGSMNAAELLADSEANKATQKEASDDSEWTFDITATDESANGTYTVAAIDEAGREEAEQITINNFDFTPPAKVKVTNAVYSSDLSAIILNWTEPGDSDYDHVDISFTSNNGTSDSTASEAVSLAKGTTNKTFSSIDGTKAYYTYTFVTYDALGNKGKAYAYKVSVKTSVSNIPEGFVEVSGKTITGSETWTPTSEVFVSGRSLTIPDLYVCDHEVTQAEYEKYCKYGSSSQYGSSSPSSIYGAGDNYPAYYVSWYDAIVYCNLRSIDEDLTPAYAINGETDPTKWTDIVSTTTDGLTKYCGTASTNDTWDGMTFDEDADGYRLPTEAEWEYIAREGKTSGTTYSGSNTIGDVAWYKENSGSKTHEVKSDKVTGTDSENALGIYDMSGNVWEWCWDQSLFSSRVQRGGSWDGKADYCTVSFRNYMHPSYRMYNVGFRVVRSSSAN